MSIFNPELREEREGFFEAKHFSPDFERRLLSALDRKRETFPDIVLCPNKSCGCPLKIQFLEDAVRAWCPSCGWEQTLTRDPSSTDGTRRDDTDF
ncbi:MAG TPA: hypothetical protein VJB64_01245 [Patescibacteria group bacterium]|nr:hypothetical protein [Patescibacteria group bacterium]